MKSKSCGVLDHPVKPGDDGGVWSAMSFVVAGLVPAIHVFS
jgi:hypothetical protein